MSQKIKQVFNPLTGNFDQIVDVTDYEAHLVNTSNPHSTTKAQVGLGNVDNTSDLDKPVSTATQTALNAKQDSLGFTPENVANKATDLTSPDNTKYPTTQAVATGLSGKQDSLGFTPENVSNKSATTTLGTSDTLYPTQNAVKTYVDTGLSGKQNNLGFTPENVANKSTNTALGASDALYPSQNAVKVYADTKISKDTGTTYTTNAVKTLTTAEYLALGTPDANTLYFIV